MTIANEKALEEIRFYHNQELLRIRQLIRTTKQDIKALVDRQSINKRKLNQIQSLINSMDCIVAKGQKK